MEKSNSSNKYTITIKPKIGWQIIDFKVLKEYQDLFFFLISRDIKVSYAQTIFGFFWALLQPLIQIILFTIVFGNIAKVSTDGIPYLLFSSVAIIPWTYMSQAMSKSSESLIAGQNMLGKIYFPRMIFPITPVLAKLVDFAISLVIVIIIIIYYKVRFTWALALLPLFVIVMMIFVFSIGMMLSAMAIRFRDVRHALPFTIRMLMYSAPIVYSASSIPESYRFLYSFNPIVGIIEGFRSCLLGLPFQWQYILPGIIITICLFFISALYFNRMERFFVDVI